MQHVSTLRRGKLALTWMQVISLILATMLPVVLASRVDAQTAVQLSNRSATIDTSEAGATFDVTFEFDLATTGGAMDAERIELEFCDSPLSTCNTTNTPTIPAASTVSQANWAQATAFGSYARGNGDNGGTDNQIEVSRTESGDEDGTTDAQVGFTGLTHNATDNQTFFTRIRIYDDAAAGTLRWEGVVAASTAEQLTITARVQETLEFCVGDTSTVAGGGDDCTDISGNDIDLGVLDSTSVNTASVEDSNGYVMLRTNASNGATIVYFADNGNGNSDGHLAKTGATCSGSSTTDGCINSVGTTEAAVSAGTEAFGMAATSVDTTGSATPTSNLTRDAQYDNSVGYAFDGTQSTDQIASSSTVVDDEMLVLDWQATASLTTPTGIYDTTLTFIATATY